MTLQIYLGTFGGNQKRLAHQAGAGTACWLGDGNHSTPSYKCCTSSRNVWPYKVQRFTPHGGNHPVRWPRQTKERVAILGEKGVGKATSFTLTSKMYKPLITIIPCQTVIIIKGWGKKGRHNSPVALSVAMKIIPPPFPHD